MPIFHDQYEYPSQQSSSSSFQLHRARHSAAGFGQIPLEDAASRASCTSLSDFTMDATSPGGTRRPSQLNRVELIERIKRGNSPAWQQIHANDSRSDASPEPRPTSRDRPATPLLPAAELKPSRPSTPDLLRNNATAGIEIERPRSALHSGDFREKKESEDLSRGKSTGVLATSPVAPWHQSFPAAALPQGRGTAQLPFHDALRYEPRQAIRSRATSQSSFHSPFVFMPPTSPLVQQSNNTDLDFSSRPASRRSSKSPDRFNRRHTFSPSGFESYRSTQLARSATGTPATRMSKRENPFPYQAHQPRRSLTSANQFQPHSTPQTPLMQPRRPSFSSEASPLHHAPMVGSYEESILRGRMSTIPSRPLNFVAQIGVLGKGQCKPNLRCPSHVTVPFPAVFYSYNSGNGRIADDSPSPYVGLVDLENSLAPPEDNNETSKRRRRYTLPDPSQDEFDFRPDGPQMATREGIRRREKRKRRSTSPKAPPGGSYRIPQQGQLQIVIKNPNKTAVKLFLVPYDLSDMEPGQKTFIRQRSYSAGPIIEMPLSCRNNLGTDRPEASLSHSDDPNDRPILRYLIHLHMCCPSKGRYYLYKSIRVVFANRVPDGKEKLRNEIQLPEPRYSSYKPTRDSTGSQAMSSAAERLTAEKATRRRSANVTLGQNLCDRMDGLTSQPPLPPPAVQFTGGASSNSFNSPVSSVRPIPFSLSRIDSRPTSRDLMDVDTDSPLRSRSNGSTFSSFNHPATPESARMETFDKLNKGDIGYGGNAFRSLAGGPAASPGAGLLARKLRGLDVQREGSEGAMMRNDEERLM